MAKATAKKKAVRSSVPEMQCFLACDAVSQDTSPGTGSGKPSLHGVFDVIYATKFPSFFRPFFVFARISPDYTGKKKIQIETYGVDGKLLGDAVLMEARFGKAKYQDVVVQYVGVPLTAYGTMRIVLKIDGKRVGWPCEITVQKPESQ